jgi:hypothetical protein
MNYSLTSSSVHSAGLDWSEVSGSKTVAARPIRTSRVGPTREIHSSHFRGRPAHTLSRLHGGSPGFTRSEEVVALVRWRFWLMTALLAVGIGCSDSVESIRTVDELRKALAVARPGDVLALGEGRFEGPFRIPAGVRVVGLGIGATVLHAPQEQSGAASPDDPWTVWVEPGEVSGLESLSVEAGSWGIVARWPVERDHTLGPGGGPPELELRNVRVSTVAGVAIDLEGLDGFRLERSRFLADNRLRGVCVSTIRFVGRCVISPYRASCVAVCWR